MSFSFPPAAAAGLMQLREQAEAAARAGQLAQTLALLAQAERLDPSQPDVQVDLAVAEFQTGQHDAARRRCERLLQQQPQLHECAFLRALCLDALGDLAATRQALIELVRGPRAAGLAERDPGLARQAAERLAELESTAPAPAPVPAPAPAPASAVARAEEPESEFVRPTGRLREFLWGDHDPYQTFPARPSDPPQPGWYSDHPIFEQLLAERRPRRLVEVGSLFGGSAVHIGRLLHKHRIDGELTCVDTFLGSCEHYTRRRGLWRRMLAAGRYNFFDEFLGNVRQAGVTDVVTPFVQTSTNAAKLFRQLGLQFDFIYLDASHEYADVLADLRAWFPLLAPGGVLVGDDFEDPWFEIIRAALEFADEIGQPLQRAKGLASSPIGRRENTKFLLYAA